MKAEIISVGTEILLGSIIDTNSKYIASKLADSGIDLYSIRTVGDNKKRLSDAFDDAFKTVDIVITTGGLGPTEDDITKETAVDYFDMVSVPHDESINNLEKYFNKICKTASKNNYKQAYFPEEAVILKNNNGTAPGAILEKDGKYIVLMPGPPREMVPMFENYVIPFIEEMTKSVLRSVTIKTCRIGESRLEEEISELIREQSNPTIATYAKEEGCEVRITAKAENEIEANKKNKPVKAKILDIIGNYVYGFDDDTLEGILIESLQKKSMTVSFAESCTGGLLSGTLVNYPGASKVLNKSFITYSNDAKIDVLGVDKSTLEKFGAVSEETAIEMAEGCKKIASSSIAVAVTGIAGPEGGTDEKPVGLVWVAISGPNGIYSEKLNLNGKRNSIRMRTVYYTMKMILDYLK